MANSRIQLQLLAEHHRSKLFHAPIDRVVLSVRAIWSGNPPSEGSSADMSRVATDGQQISSASSAGLPRMRAVVNGTWRGGAHIHAQVWSHRQAHIDGNPVACLLCWAPSRSRPWLGMVGVLALLTMINPSESRGQSASVEVVPSIGYLRLFGGEGVQSRFEVNRRIGSGPAVAHWVGALAQYSNTDLATAARPARNDRVTYALGASYSLRIRPDRRVSAGLVVPVAHVWSNNSDNPFLADVGGDGVPPAPEDLAGAEGTGIMIGLEGILRLRLSSYLDLIASGGLGHNPIYPNQQSRALSYLRLGVAMRP